MSFELPEPHEQLRRRARAVAEKVRERAAEADAATDVDPVMLAALRESGLAALTVPAAHGGASERVDSLAGTVVREAFGGVSAHLDSLFAMQGIGSYALAVGASERIQKEWLPRVVSLDAIAALGLTEPDVGSDLKSISTSVAQRDGELVLNGRKSFITNAGAAHFLGILAKEGDGYSLVLVPPDSPGVRVVSGPDLIAPHIHRRRRARGRAGATRLTRRAAGSGLPAACCRTARVPSCAPPPRPARPGRGLRRSRRRTPGMWPASAGRGPGSARCRRCSAPAGWRSSSFGCSPTPQRPVPRTTRWVPCTGPRWRRSLPRGPPAGWPTGACR